MPGFKLTTDLGIDPTLRQAFKIAGEMGFVLTPIGDQAFRAQKGYLAANLILGSLAVRCDFQVALRKVGDNTELAITHNSGWLTGGLLGKSRIRGQAEQLANGIAAAIKESGGTVLTTAED